MEEGAGLEGDERVGHGQQMPRTIQAPRASPHRWQVLLGFLDCVCLCSRAYALVLKAMPARTCVVEAS